ncbi:MAG: 3-keto-disaccharide hydrolase [Bryobacteraceae bacterium]
MNRRSLWISGAAGAALLMTSAGWSEEKTGAKWVSMFDGKTLNGWKASERPENWKVENGAIVGRGERSHLFWMKEECGNCEFKATIKLNKGGNSGMYFRAAFGDGWPKGYEAQVNNSHKDPVKTGSLYNIVKIYDQKVKDDTWWTQHIIADGNHIVIKVNDEVVVDHVDEKNTYMKGYLALQQHDPGSVVMYKDLMYRKLPDKK